jgi:hypothetical protein
MMMRETPRPFAEDSPAELWRWRQIAKEMETEGKEKRQGIETEFFRRFEETGGKSMPLGDGKFVTITETRSGWAYEPGGVEALREHLVGGNIITEDDWLAAVSYTPHIDGHAVNRWLKIADPEIARLIDRARMGQTGRPQLAGPPLEEMEEKEDGE